MRDLSIDIETLGTKSYSCIISIGAAFFDPSNGEVGETFYREIDIDSAKELGLVTDPSTLAWWEKQSEEARSIFLAKDRPKITDVLQEFSDWVKGHCDPKKVRPWGNGAGFDVNLVQDAFHIAGVETPWMFWNIRDIRTVVAMCKPAVDITKMVTREGTHHNALDDAIHQAKFTANGCMYLRRSQNASV